MHHNIAATDLSSVDVCVHQPCCVHTSLVSRCASRALHSQTMLRPTRSCFPSSTRCSSGRTRRVPPSHRRRRQASCARRWSAQSAHQPPQRYVCNNTLAEQNLLHQHVHVSVASGVIIPWIHRRSTFPCSHSYSHGCCDRCFALASKSSVCWLARRPTMRSNAGLLTKSKRR